MSNILKKQGNRDTDNGCKYYTSIFQLMLNKYVGKRARPQGSHCLSKNSFRL